MASANSRPTPRRPLGGGVRLVSSKLHLWVGLALGLVLVVLSVTGSALVFRHEVDRALNPGLLRVEPAGAPAPLAAAVGAAERAAGADVRLVRLPRQPGHALEAWLTDGRQAYVDPYRADVLGLRGTEEGAMNVLFALHAELLGGTTGGLVVGAIGLLTLLLAATGLVLWWPARFRWGRLRRALAVEWKKGPWRLNYDLHQAGGFWTAAFLVVVAATGSALIYYQATGSILNAATRSEAPPPPPTVGPAEAALAPGVLDGALATARRVLPDAEPTFVTPPTSEGAPLAVRLKTPEEWHPNGRSYVYLAPATGRVLRVDDAREAPAGARVLHLAYPLHIGAFGGGWVRVLYVLLGLSPAVLSVTGTLIWYRRWRRRHRQLGGTTPARRAVPARPPGPVRHVGV